MPFRRTQQANLGLFLRKASFAQSAKQESCDNQLQSFSYENIRLEPRPTDNESEAKRYTTAAVYHNLLESPKLY